MKRKNKTYVVFNGRNPGIYTTWAEAEREVLGYPGAVHQSYHDISVAKAAFESGDPNFGVERGDMNGDVVAQGASGKCYAVFVGRKIGIFSTQHEAEEQTESYPDGYYDVYTSHQEAIEALERFLMGAPFKTTGSNNGKYSPNKTTSK